MEPQAQIDASARMPSIIPRLAVSATALRRANPGAFDTAG
jgi:hypothetical protein